MEKKWILFYREVGYVYYFYNGEQVICVSEEKIPWAREADEETPIFKSLLDEVNGNKRKKLIEINKIRFIVVARGELLEED